MTPQAEIGLFIGAEAQRGLANLPEHMHEGLALWLLRGIPPGSFLRNVLCNDLMGAAMHADDWNRDALYEWARWLYCHAPRGSYGSVEAVADWQGLLPKEVSDETA